MIPALVTVISKVSPVLGAALGGPMGGVVASLISSILGVNMQNPDDVAKKLDDPQAVQKLKELEMQVTDLQNARLEASKETGLYRLVRPLMALFAMVAIIVDIYAIDHINDGIVSQVLVVMLIFLVWDIRQIYKFYFGSGEDVPISMLSK